MTVEPSSVNSGTFDDCLRFLDNVSDVRKRCIINYEFKVPPSEVPPEFADIINSPPINAINGEETSKFINDDDKKVRRQFIDIIKAKYISQVLDKMKSRGIIPMPKNAAWKTRDSFYSMYRCNCKAQRILQNDGAPMFSHDQFESLNSPNGNANNHAKSAFSNVTSVTDVILMWMAENNGETTNFKETKKKNTVSNDEMQQFFENFKHLEEENSYSSIEFLKNDDKFEIIGNCPAYLSITFKLSTLEFKLKVRYFPHDPSIEIMAMKRKDPQPRKKKVKLDTKPELSASPSVLGDDIPSDVKPILEDDKTNSNSVMDLNFINNDSVGIIKDK